MRRGRDTATMVPPCLFASMNIKAVGFLGLRVPPALPFPPIPSQPPHMQDQLVGGRRVQQQLLGRTHSGARLAVRFVRLPHLQMRR